MLGHRRIRISIIESKFDVVFKTHLIFKNWLIQTIAIEVSFIGVYNGEDSKTLAITTLPFLSKNHVYENIQAQIWPNFKNIVVNLYVAISISFRGSEKKDVLMKKRSVCVKSFSFISADEYKYNNKYNNKYNKNNHNDNNNQNKMKKNIKTFKKNKKK